MKKFLVLSIVGLFIFAFGTAYAQEKAPTLEFKASGFVDTVATTYRNISTSSGPLFGPPISTYRPGVPNGDAFDKSHAWINERARLKFDAIMGKEMSGTIYFEMDSTRWGDSGSGRNNMGAVAADQAGLEIKSVYLDFGVPVIPVQTTMRIGVQTMGIRPAMFLLTDMAGITVGIKPVDPLTMSLMWGKLYEGSDYAADDTDFYAVHGFYKMGTVTLGGHVTYYNMNTYRLNDWSATSIPYRADMWWLGAYADGKVGPVNLNFDFIYDTGEVKARTGIPAGAKRTVDYSGWVGAVKVAYPWEKFEFGLKALYASGNDAKKTSQSGLPGSGTAYDSTQYTKDVEGYVVPPASEAFGAFGEDVVFYGTSYDRGGFGNGVKNSYTQVHGAAFGGTWFAKLFVKAAVTPDLKLTGQAIYIGDTTKSGNTIGNAVKSNGNLRDDSYIGTEVDLLADYMIYKNLRWSAGIGYLFAGDGLEYAKTATTNDEAKDPWRLVTQIMYTF